MKTYNYKNGEIAIYVADEKVLINEDEQKNLFGGIQMFTPDNTDLYKFLADELSTSKYIETKTSVILDFYRNNKCEALERSANDTYFLIYRINGEIKKVAVLSEKGGYEVNSWDYTMENFEQIIKQAKTIL